MHSGISRPLPRPGGSALDTIIGTGALALAAYGAYEQNVGLALVGLALTGVAGLRIWQTRGQRVGLGGDEAVIVTDADGQLLQISAAARSLAGPGGRLEELLNDRAETPASLIYRLAREARETGGATAFVTLAGQGSRHLLSVRPLGDERLSWSVLPLPTMVDSDQTLPDAGFGQMRIDETGAVVAANAQVRRWAGRRVARDADVVNDLPMRAGSIHRLRADPSMLVRAQLADPDVHGVRDVFLYPVADAELAAANPDQFLAQLPIALARIDVEGRVIIANAAAQGLVGRQMEPGARLADLMEGLAQPVAQRIREVAATRRPARPEVSRILDGDIERFLQVSFSPIEVAGDFSLLVVMSDATELKTLEAQFVQSQKMQAVGQLAGGVAHDFNNLLTALSGHCDLLLLRHAPGDRDYSDLIQIRQNADRAAALVGQLLAFSRKQTLQPKVLHLADVLGDLSHLLNRLLGEKVTLRLDYREDLPAVRVDLRQFEQVIMNLVVNARDAMPDGGEVSLHARYEHLADELKRDRATITPGDWVVIEVSDTGVGIPEWRLDKIFDPFFTTKRVGEGTGLGLSTAYGIVKQTGGFIFVDSIVGEGTTFSIYLPRFVPGPGEQPRLLEGDKRSGEPGDATGSGTVLLVEDEAPVRAFAARALKLRGYHVLEAASGEEALELLAEKPAVDIFVSDVIMPGLDGPSWVAQAREAYPDVQVIFVSGYAEDMFRDGMDLMPNSSFLAKPFSLNDLTLRVKERLELGRQAPS
ncbi:ATP-binding protein [Pontivivens ytuae]|uniref:histidine kinase n=1 Tax=Pontivivens ytuae TaxID=2789856 RepID=A0A7S9LR78_9RHOB|nr:ATP-binding protein [Pontivivens ytuae]QPH53614.1 response regulator [Pontivivens ytuae]